MSLAVLIPCGHEYELALPCVCAVSLCKHGKICVARPFENLCMFFGGCVGCTLACPAYTVKADTDAGNKVKISCLICDVHGVYLILARIGVFAESIRNESVCADIFHLLIICGICASVGEEYKHSVIAVLLDFGLHEIYDFFCLIFAAHLFDKLAVSINCKYSLIVDAHIS